MIYFWTLTFPHANFLSCIPIANHKNMTFVRVNILHKRCMEFHLEDTRPHLKCTSRNIGSSPQNNFRFLTADFIQGGGMLPSNVSRCLYFFLFFLISSASCLVQQGNRYTTSTLPTYSSNNTDEMLRRLNDDLESTSRWIKLNGLALNLKKCLVGFEVCKFSEPPSPNFFRTPLSGV